MKQCSYCRTKFEEDVAECNKCGAKLLPKIKQKPIYRRFCTKCGTEMRRVWKIDHINCWDGLPRFTLTYICPNRRTFLDGHNKDGDDSDYFELKDIPSTESVPEFRGGK